MNVRLLVALSLTAPWGVVGCANETNRTPLVHIDSLPGGIPRVHSTSGSWRLPDGGWRVVPDLTLRTAGEGDSALENPHGLALDTDERLYVSDRVITLRDTAGRYLRTVGGLGGGPGEYTESPTIGTQGNNLLVQDAAQARLTVFDSAGRLRFTWHTLCCVPYPPFGDTLGRVFVVVNGSGPEAGQRFLRADLDGSHRDTVSLPPAVQNVSWNLKTGFGPWSYGVPFTPHYQAALTPGGEVIHGWPSEYRMLRSQGGLDTLQLIERDWSPTPVSSTRRTAAVERVTSFLTEHGANLGGVSQAEMDRVITLASVPTTAPAYRGLTVDPLGYVWVELDPGDDSSHTLFDIFDPTGAYLGPVTVPGRLDPFGATAWGRTVLWAIQEDTAGYPVLQRYRIVRSR